MSPAVGSMIRGAETWCISPVLKVIFPKVSKSVNWIKIKFERLKSHEKLEKLEKIDAGRGLEECLL